MGKRGPKPTPKSILKLRGSWRAGLGGEGPQFAPGAPDCPEHVQGAAREEWERVTPLLEQAGLLATVDRAALAAYCVTWARWAEAEAMVAKSGTVLKSPDGGLCLNPYLRVADKALEQMQRLLAEFGLSPSSRARVSPLSDASSNETKQGKSRFFAG